MQDEDDHVDRVEDPLSYYAVLKKVGVPVEIVEERVSTPSRVVKRECGSVRTSQQG
jgi:hypothetical protein